MPPAAPRRRTSPSRLTGQVVVAALAAAVVSALVSLTALLGTTAGPAVADTADSAATADTAEAGVDISRDGVTWGDEITTPLWQPDLLWQPGDVRTSTLYVRNTSGAAADLEVELARGSTGGASDTLVTISGARPSTSWTTVTTGGPARTIVVPELGPGRSVPVILRASLDAAAPVDTDVDTSEIRLAARLGTSVPETASGEGWLSNAHLELAPIFLGFALIVAAVAGRRRTGPDRFSD